MCMNIEQAIRKVNELTKHCSNTTLEQAIQLQRNEIIKKELEDICCKLEEIRYSMTNGLLDYIKWAKDYEDTAGSWESLIRHLYERLKGEESDLAKKGIKDKIHRYNQIRHECLRVARCLRNYE